MKYVVLLMFVLLNNHVIAQTYLKNINSKNSFDVLVRKNGILIHSHIMIPGDVLKIDCTEQDTLTISLKYLTRHCDCPDDSHEVTQLKITAKKYTKYYLPPDEWKSINIIGQKSYFWGMIRYKHILILPKFICPQA